MEGRDLDMLVESFKPSVEVGVIRGVSESIPRKRREILVWKKSPNSRDEPHALADRYPPRDSRCRHVARGGAASASGVGASEKL